MEFVVRKGKKLAVHCHAGKGRTALVVCAFLIYQQGLSAEQAIDLFKKKRSGSFKKSSQIKTLKEFEVYLNKHNINYFVGKKCAEIVESESIITPENPLHDDENNKMPRFIEAFFERLFELLTQTNADLICKAFTSPIESKSFEQLLFEAKKQCQKSSNLKTMFISIVQIDVLCQLFLDFLEDLSDPFITHSSISCMRFFMKNSDSMTDGRFKQSYYLSSKQVDESEMKMLFLLKTLYSELKNQNCNDLHCCLFRIIVALLKIKIVLPDFFLSRSIVNFKMDFNIGTIAIHEFINFINFENCSQSLADSISIFNSPLKNYTFQITLNKSNFLRDQNKINLSTDVEGILSQFTVLRPDLQKSVFDNIKNKIMIDSSNETSTFKITGLNLLS